MSACLWICPACEMIGEEAFAERHMEGSGHAISKLPQDVSDALRARWARMDLAELEAFMTLPLATGSVDLNVNPPEKEIPHGRT